MRPAVYHDHHFRPMAPLQIATEVALLLEHGLKVVLHLPTTQYCLYSQQVVRANRREYKLICLVQFSLAYDTRDWSIRRVAERYRGVEGAIEVDSRRHGGGKLAVLLVVVAKRLRKSTTLKRGVAAGVGAETSIYAHVIIGKSAGGEYAAES